MAPAEASAEWVHVRPLRRPPPTPGQRKQPTSGSTTTPQDSSSSLPIPGLRLPASSSFVLAAARLRALQLDPARAPAQTGSQEESQSKIPRRPSQVTGSDHHALLTARAPMGA